ncbi:MAG: hypothetical protein AAF401_16490 [Pseudomonadota bacterium]
MAGRSQLVKHWRKLRGAVHPVDAPVFEKYHHSFNLDWPPPAYVGDVNNAPFILLMMNGGYHQQDTAAEFNEEGSVNRYIENLHNPRAVKPQYISKYYAAGNYGDFISDGRLALVNAIAYRSGKLSEEKQNQQVAELLPSTQLHRQWLFDELIPQAMSGKRFVIAHRNRFWKIRRSDFEHPNIVFTNSPASPYLPKNVVGMIRAHC